MSKKFNECSLHSTIILRYFKQFRFLSSLLLVPTKFLFLGRDWALGYNSMKFRDFPDLSEVLSRSATREATGIYHVYY